MRESLNRLYTIRALFPRQDNQNVAKQYISSREGNQSSTSARRIQDKDRRNNGMQRYRM